MILKCWRRKVFHDYKWHPSKKMTTKISFPLVLIRPLLFFITLKRIKKVHKQKKTVFKENWNFSINCLFSVIVQKSTTWAEFKMIQRQNFQSPPGIHRKLLFLIKRNRWSLNQLILIAAFCSCSSSIEQNWLSWQREKEDLHDSTPRDL